MIGSSVVRQEHMRQIRQHQSIAAAWSRMGQPSKVGICFKEKLQADMSSYSHVI